MRIDSVSLIGVAPHMRFSDICVVHVFLSLRVRMMKRVSPLLMFYKYPLPICRQLIKLFRFSSLSFRRSTISQNSDKKNNNPPILNFKKKFGVLDKERITQSLAQPIPRVQTSITCTAGVLFCEVGVGGGGVLLDRKCWRGRLEVNARKMS